MEKKEQALKEYIRQLGSLAVGFSGGVDSAYLLAVAHEVLQEKAVALTATGVAFPEREQQEAREFCKKRGIRQILCPVEPLQIEEFRNNGPQRCYFCKRDIFARLQKAAGELGIAQLADGTNVDDLVDYRPGLRAVTELGLVSPLREAGLAKAEIRLLSKKRGLPTWSKPAYACLASRFASGEEITEEKLYRVDRAEQFLIEQGFPEERVRVHGDLARIEVAAEDIARLADGAVREKIVKAFRALGFRFVSLDLEGYRTGSMNAEAR